MLALLLRAALILLVLICGSTSMAAEEQAVIVHFHYGSNDLSRLFALEDRLESAIVEAAVGEFDGNEIAIDGSDGTLFMYGPDAEKLAEVVRPILEATDFMNGAVMILRYGPPEEGIEKRAVRLSYQEVL